MLSGNLINLGTANHQCEFSWRFLTFSLPFDRALRWDDDAEEKIMNVLILSNVFTPYELIDDSELHDDIIEDMKMKCSQFGEVLKVKLYPNTSPGVVSVVFREGKAAFEASKKCEGLSYNKHRLSAELYDGVTNYDGMLIFTALLLVVYIYAVANLIGVQSLKQKN